MASLMPISYGIFFFVVILFALVFFILFKTDQEGKDLSHAGGGGVQIAVVLLIGMIIFLPAFIISMRRVQNATADFVDPQKISNTK